MIEAFVKFVERNKVSFDAVHAAVSVVNLIGITITLLVLLVAWRRGKVQSVNLFGANITLAREALVAASRAVDQHEFGAQSRVTSERARAIARKPGERSQAATAEIDRVRAIIEHAFRPDVQTRLLGKAILWVDDNPQNNESEVTALRKMGLVVDQAESTEAGLQALTSHPYDMVISDMGRGSEKFAGYQLLEQIRARQNPVPFVLYTADGSKPEHRAAALQRSALGSTDYPHELLELIVSRLGN